MIVSDPSVLAPESPTIDIVEANWAIEYLGLMIGQLEPGSPVRMVLTQARRELVSLTQSTSGGMVIGPLRIAA